MGFHHRKFLTEICEFICNGKQSPSNCSSIKDCNSCFKLCLPNPQFPFFNYPPPPPPPPPPQQEFPPFNDQNQHKLTNYFILTLSIVAFVFFFICIRAICIAFRSRRRRRLLEVTMERERAPPSVLSASSSMIRQIDENFDESIVDHPIWYIRTLGLNKSVINSISVCNYKKNDGLIEGTECAVCLSEFEEDENLRVLPKCHHAFHLPCIDTWLSSHTNCPMCRASIVSNSTTNPEIARVGSLESLESVVVVVDDDDDLNSRSLENAQINQVFEEDSVDDETNFDSESRSRVVDEEGEGQFEVCENERRVSVVRPRRSVSMDDSFVANVNNALATVLSIESKDDGDSSRMVFNEDTVSKVDNGDENLAAITKGSTSKSFSFRSTRNLQGVPSPIRRSSSYNGKFLMSGIAAIRRSRRLF